jgi:hypothetical protein
MEVGGQLHTPAILPWEKSPWYPLIGGQVGPRAGLHTVARKKNLCPSQELNTGHSAHSLVTIQTELSQLLDVLWCEV